MALRSIHYLIRFGRPPIHYKRDQPSINALQLSTIVEGWSPADMATHTSGKQTSSPSARESRNGSEQPTASPLINEASMARARAASLIVAAALCNALAGQVLYAMSAADPWWLAHAASLTIRFFGVDIANRLEISNDYGFALHVGVVALGWALDRAFLALGVFIR